MQSRHILVLVLASVLAAMGFLVAGCGGGTPSASVANLGTTGTTPTTTTGGSGGGGGGGTGPSTSSSSARGGGMQIQMNPANGAKFSSCMRSHGVPRFPDPSSSGAMSIGRGSGIDPNSPKFRAAQTACEKLLPNGGQPTAAQQARMQQQALAFSACMRSHGVPSFPDPSFSGGHVQLSIKGGSGTGIDPRSPKFQAAQKACQGKLPGKIGAATGSGK